MKKGKKQLPVWLVFGRGLLVSLAIYLAGHLLLAALMVRGALAENGAYPVTAVLGLLSAFCGGLCVARRSPWGPLPGGVLLAAIFGLSLAAVGALFWQQVSWTGSGGILLACILAGGILAGLVRAGRSKSRRRLAL